MSRTEERLRAENVDSKELRELIEIIGKSNFVTFELEQNGFKLRLEKGTAAGGAVTAQAPAPASVVHPVPVIVPVAPAAAPVAVVAVAAPPSPPPTAEPARADLDAGVVSMTSPIVGTFYRKSNPDAANFVEVGSRVKKRQVLCIVEAMKLMNEIEAEMDAEVVEILASNAQPVEYGEVIFRLRPLS